jgi:hypothetical protein
MCVVPRDSRAAHQLATELPLCFEAVFGLGRRTNNLNLAQMVGAMQLGYLRAWLRLIKPSCDLCRLHEAIANGTSDPGISTSTVAAQALAVGDDALGERRCDGFRAYSIALACKPNVNGRSNSTIAGRVANA